MRLVCSCYFAVCRCAMRVGAPQRTRSVLGAHCLHAPAYYTYHHRKSQTICCRILTERRTTRQCCPKEFQFFRFAYTNCALCAVCQRVARCKRLFAAYTACTPRLLFYCVSGCFDMQAFLPLTLCLHLFENGGREKVCRRV